MTTDGTSDFYEEDEAPEEVWATFERAEKTVTKRPPDLTERIKVPKDLSAFNIDGVIVQGEPEALRHPVTPR